VIGADGLSLFDELRRTEGARVAFLYAFDILGYDGEDLREQPLLVRRKALARLLRHSQSGIVFNEHIVEDGSVVFAHACRLGAEGIVLKRIDAPYRSGPYSAWIKVRNPASIAVQREVEQVIARADGPDLEGKLGTRDRSPARGGKSQNVIDGSASTRRQSEQAAVSEAKSRHAAAG
jgi:ATP-dependent DNA ligase